MNFSMQLIEQVVNIDVHIGQGLLSKPLLSTFLATLHKRVVIITDTNCEALYGQLLLEDLKERGFKVELFSVEPGEQSKSRKTKESLEDTLLANEYGRDTTIIGLGGGVILDLAGFIASTYCRGVPFIMLPTTLLAMSDACLGGKTGVNIPQAKNMIGTIYQPRAIFIDTATLETLPIDEYKNGLVECIKHGLIMDEAYFSFLEEHVDAMLNREPAIVEQLISQSLSIKKAIVQDDAHEAGMRRLCNFGHTIGHAIEAIRHIPHGQAVAIGILAESYLSMQLKILSEYSFERIRTIFQAYSIDTFLDVSSSALLEVMKRDKKALLTTPRFVMLQEIGRCLPCDGQYCMSVAEDVLQGTLNWLEQQGTKKKTVQKGEGQRGHYSHFFSPC